MPPDEVLKVFVEHEHLKNWWGVSRSLIDVKKGGLYSLTWQRNDKCVDYVSSGIITEYLPGCQLKIEKMVYINPQRPILGPTELLVLTTPLDQTTTELTVLQAGYQSGPDWEWYYQTVLKAWPEVLSKIKAYLEEKYVGETK